MNQGNSFDADKPKIIYPVNLMPWSYKKKSGLNPGTAIMTGQ